MEYKDSFGGKLRHYRDAKECLSMTQSDFAQALSASPLYTITQEDVAAWEANKKLDQIDEPLYSVIEETLCDLAKGKEWSEKDIQSMRSKLRAAYVQRLEDHSADPNNAFSKRLNLIREKLKLTQEELFNALAGDALSGEYIAQVEGGAKPSLRFILASADYFKERHVLQDFTRSEYINSGKILRDTPVRNENNENVVSRATMPKPAYLSSEEKLKRQRDLGNEILFLFGDKKAATDGIVSKWGHLPANFLYLLKSSQVSPENAFKKKDGIMQAFDEHMKDHPDYVTRRARLEEILEAFVKDNFIDIAVTDTEFLPGVYGIKTAGRGPTAANTKVQKH